MRLLADGRTFVFGRGVFIMKKHPPIKITQDGLSLPFYPIKYGVIVMKD